MTRTAHSEGRPTPVFRECDGAPWPSDDELELEAEWAAFRESGDVEWWSGDESAQSGEASSAAVPAATPGGATASGTSDSDDVWSIDDLLSPLDGGAAAVSDIDARLGHLECVVTERQRATADEYRLILAILDDAAFDPTPWVGHDPTLDRAWNDPRGRTPGAVRRDRIDLAERAAVAEVAVRLRLSEQTVRTRAAHARTLAVDCPRLWTAFSEGRLSEKHAVDAARLASTLPAGDDAAFQRFDDEACPQALVLPPAKFAVAARAIRERVHAESLEARHRRAAEDRGVWMRAELDGMASLHALLPADRARAVMSRLDRAARHLRAAPDEERTLAQLRADAFADLVTMTEDPGQNATAPSPDTAPESSTSRAAVPTPPVAGTAKQRVVAADAKTRPSDAATRAPVEADSAENAEPHEPVTGRTFRAAPPATVVVTIPALTLLSRDSEPATLEGYGPIDLETARRLAGNATSWIRLLTHPVTGAPLVLDRKTYRVPVALRRWLGVTSPTCVFPGCGRAARECDIDHLTAWADGGTTDDDNLDPKCRHHHRLRHETRWDLDRAAGGDTAWISPLGGRYGTDPPPF
ncbi:HNH endonuclease signature motif containing protein [Microbacterium sp. BH-3-3-3]|uniref:HNH endonuclease signature motif containing protein n=1 Tax=Microbacterium sp. BH-3-3-3 TaxID=1906742 RepID=UPI00119E5047|nr:HNH endonuclease signature motif containing protein [Microbacterium sp. BH-3-3-3]